jgi:peptidoglycan/xylan/chitin deacetylase (PgdA/CDA1 family)
MRARIVSVAFACVVVWVLVGVVAPRRADSQAGPAQGANLKNPQPGTKLTVDELKAQFFHVHAGRRLRPKSWPGGNRVAVALSFDLDNNTIALTSGRQTLSNMSAGEYGGIDGLPRVLEVLDKHNVPATFFVPAVADILQPSIIQSIMSRKRHEIGSHGWLHENLSQIATEAEERRLLTQAVDYLTKVTGKRPVGYRSPGANFSPWSIKLLKEAGFIYESTLMSSDDAYELNIDGQPSGLIELPIEWILDDDPYNSPTGGTFPSPETVYKVYRSEFDIAYEERGLFVLTMHPHETGRRSRAAHLDKFIAYIKSKPGVWIATQEEIARHVKTAGE